jgi:hypothetical protein
MALTVAVDSRFQNLAGKTLSIQSVLTSKIKDVSTVITFGATDDYSSDGNIVDLSLGGRIKTILDVTPISNTKGLLLEYVPDTNNEAVSGKLKCFGVDPAASGGAVVGFTELADASTTTRDMVVKLRVRGF